MNTCPEFANLNVNLQTVKADTEPDLSFKGGGYMFRLLGLISVFIFSCSLGVSNSEREKPSALTGQHGVSGDQNGQRIAKHKGFGIDGKATECEECFGINCPIYSCAAPWGTGTSYPDEQSYENTSAEFQKQCIAKKYQILICPCLSLLCSGDAKE